MKVAAKVRSFFQTQTPHIILELVHTQNVALVENDAVDAMEAAMFAAGSVYSNSFLDALVCQAHFNPGIIEIITAFLGTFERWEGANSPTGRRAKRNHSSLSRSTDAVRHQLMLLMVPEEYIGHKYHELLSGLAQHRGSIALGLYRMPGAEDAPTGYVVTNPLPDTLLCPGDRMYVITCQVEYVDDDDAY